MARRCCAPLTVAPDEVVSTESANYNSYRIYGFVSPKYGSNVNEQEKNEKKNQHTLLHVQTHVCRFNAPKLFSHFTTRNTDL